MLRTKPHAARVAHQDSIGPLSGQKAEDIDFTGLLDARGRQKNRGGSAVAADHRDGLGILLDVLIIGVNRRNAEPQGRLDLIGTPTENG
jgi:hypothetical protein